MRRENQDLSVSIQYDVSLLRDGKRVILKIDRLQNSQYRSFTNF